LAFGWILPARRPAKNSNERGHVLGRMSGSQPKILSPFFAKVHRHGLPNQRTSTLKLRSLTASDAIDPISRCSPQLLAITLLLADGHAAFHRKPSLTTGA